MQQQAASKTLVVAIGLLGVALTIGNVLLFAFVKWLQHSAPSSDGLLLQLCFAEAFMSAEGSLVAIGIAFVTRPLPVRLALAVPGVAIAFLPTLASVYYEYAERLAKSDKEVPTILGCAIAHEVGHLLLGPSSHSGGGIMRGEWGPKELQLALMGRLLFASQQAKLIRALRRAT
jgi:hypothetical protein